MPEENESHPCVFEGCKDTVPYDDEPWCYIHSPFTGSTVAGYSYKREAARSADAPSR